MNTNTNTKRTTEAKAKAKAEASVKATASRLMAEPTEAERVHAMLTPSTGTVAEHLANVNTAAAYLAKTEADAFAAKVMARQAIGAEMFAAYKVKVTEADANTEVKAADVVTFTALAAAIFPVGKATKAEYEGLTTKARPVTRSWSALAEDWALYVHTAGNAWRAAYDLSRGEAEPTVRGYLTFARQANAAEAEATTTEGETAQAKGARTKAVSLAASKAEATRQAEAKDRREAEAKAKAEEATRKAEADALARVTHVLTYPAANAVPGVDLTGATLAASAPKVLRDLAATCLAVAAHTEAEAEAVAAKAKADGTTTPSVAGIVAEGQAKATEAAASHDTEADAAALGAKAEANGGADIVTIVAAVMAQMAATTA